MAAPPPHAAIARLGETLDGPLIGRSHAGYDAARRVWNGRVDRRLLIARCANVADISACVRFAREHELTLATRGSGHACARPLTSCACGRSSATATRPISSIATRTSRPQMLRDDS